MTGSYKPSAGPNAGIHAIDNVDAKGNLINMLYTTPDGTKLGFVIIALYFSFWKSSAQ